MLVLPTAKTLFFLATCVGPHNPTTIYATSISESYVWKTNEYGGWTGLGKGFPSSDFTRDRTKALVYNTTPPPDEVADYLKSVAQHDWSHDSAVVFDNGDRVEKHGDHGFYIMNAGGANQKVFTFLYA